MEINGMPDELVELYSTEYSSLKVDSLIARGWKLICSCGSDNYMVILQRTHKLHPGIIKALTDIREFLNETKEYTDFINDILYNDSLNSESPDYCIPPSVNFDLYNKLNELYDIVIHSDGYGYTKLRSLISPMFIKYLYDE